VSAKAGRVKTAGRFGGPSFTANVVALYLQASIMPVIIIQSICMNYKPMEVSYVEMQEIAEALKPIWDQWGAESAEEMLEILEQSYCVKFDFVSGNPGYVGDLFIVQGDALADAPPIELTRPRNGKLEIVDYA
jgi:hypothetical protein